MVKGKKSVEGLALREVKTAGFKQTKRVSGVNRRAGLHDKNKNLEGETRVKRRKPLALKHVRRMRKAALALSAVFVAALAAVGVGFFRKSPVEDLPDTEYLTVCYETPKDGTLPTDHTLVENVGYMNYVLQNQPFWSSEMHSTVNTVMSQNVHTYKQYYDGVLISADIAQGVSSEATQFCVADGVVMWRPSANKNFDGMNTPWSTKDAEGLTVQQFKKKRGLPPSEFSVYVLNEKTIANAQDYSVTDNGDGTFTMSLVLNVNTGEAETSADYYYKQQMLVTGGLDEHPVIEQTTLTYTFDKDWRVLGFSIADSYSAKMGISVHCTSNTDVTFYYEEEKAKNSFYEDYFKGEYEKLKDTLGNEDDSESQPPAPNPLNYLAAAFGNVLTEGATFKLDLSVDELDLSGVVYVGLDNGALSDVRVKLGDIYVLIDEAMTLYATDGNVGYKLGIGDMLSSAEGGEGSVAGLDVNALIEQLTAGTFTIEGNTAVFDTKLGLSGLTINLSFEFNTENGIELGHVAAEISLGEKLIKAKLCYGTNGDIPAKPDDIAGYTDILNEGLTLDLGVKFDNLTLDGVAKLIMNEGAFGGLYATLGDFAVYYGYPENMLYLTDGNLKYKLALSELGGAAVPAVADALGVNPLIAQIINNISAGDGKISTAAALELFEQSITAALGVKLTGGIAVDADITFAGKQVQASVALSDKTVELSDLNGYTDVLKDGLTLGVTLKVDGLELKGRVTLDLNGGFNGVRADFGDIALYFENATQNLYLRVGDAKALVKLASTDESSVDISAILADGGVSDILSQLINNMVTGLKEISTSADLTVSDSVITAKLGLNLDGGLNLNAETVLFGINLTAGISFAEESVPALSAEDKESYIDVLENSWELIDGVIGQSLTASVEGTLYSYEEAYAEYGYEKYKFSAAFEYDKGVTADGDGNVTVNGFPVHLGYSDGKLDNFYLDGTVYLHFNLALKAILPADDSLYLDLYLFDANPETDGESGFTTGSYTKDGNLDVYLSVSKYGPEDKDNNPLKIYAPADEIMGLVSMVCAMANIDDIQFKDNAALNEAVAAISDIVNALLIDKHIANIKDQFSSLGESLIPQILGKNLNEFLGELIEMLGNTKEEVETRKFKLTDEFIKSVRYGNDSLKIVLNSSEIYLTEMDAENDITAELNRADIDGKTRISDIKLNNIFFGENNANKLDLWLNLGYGGIEKPADLGGYLNADGIDTLLKAIVNSATHETPDGETQYALNHEYILSGTINVNLDVLNVAKVDLPLTVNTLAVYIDEVTNKVTANVHISYPGKKATAIGVIPVTAVNGTSDVYMTIKEDIVCIKRIQTTNADNKPITPVTEYREMTLDGFLADIMNQIGFILNLSDTIASNLGKIDTSGGSGSGISFEGKDFGACLDYVIDSYTVEERIDGASWNVDINGGLLSDLAGMETDKIPVSFGAYKNADGTYTVNNLSIATTTVKIPLIGKSGVTIVLNGDFVYCNPHEEFNKDGNGDYYENTACDLTALTAVADSAFNAGDGFIGFNGGYRKTFTQKYGTKIYLPLNVLHNENGQLYTLEGYFLGNGTEYYSFAETYTDGNGVKYGLAEITDNSLEFTADWKKLYTVTFAYEDGSTETRNYYENEKLTPDNLPAVPEKYGFTGEWLGAEGTAVTENESYSLKYTAVDYQITLTGSQPINETGADGYYEFENNGNFVTFYATYGTAVSLPALTSNTYIAEGVYDNPEFNGEPLTEIQIDGAATYYIKWVGKTFNVVYESDIAFDSSALDNTMRFGDGDDYLASVASEGNAFLGWFIADGEKYKYIADANALKAYLSQSEFEDGSTVTLFAVWQCDYSVKVTKAKYSFKFFVSEWQIGGEFSMNYASDLSREILTNSDVSVATYAKFGQGDENSLKDVFQDYKSFSGTELDLTHTCGQIHNYGWIYVKVAYVCGDTEICASEKYDRMKK